MSTFEKPSVRHKQAHPSGGLQLLDEGNVIPGAIKDFAAKIANKLVKAQLSDILKTSAPAFIHYPKTYLEGAADDVLYASKYLNKAAETMDPIERLKLVICFYIGGTHIVPSQVQCRAPLNPIIGETVQRVLPDGTKFFGEQTSHHPPITNFLLEGPNGSYRFSGYFEYKAWLSGLSSLGGSRIGKQIMTFKDGGLLTLKDPQILISGLTYGDRVHNMVGTMTLTDHINKLEAVVTYNPSPPSDENSGGMMKAFKKKLFKRTNSTILSDYMQIQIMQKAMNGKNERVVISEGSGSWLEYIEFDGQLYWTVEEPKPQWLLPNDESLSEDARNFLLPSDSILRPDMQGLKDKDFATAEKEKEMLEEVQRRDKKARQLAQKNRESQKK